MLAHAVGSAHHPDPGERGAIRRARRRRWIAAAADAGRPHLAALQRAMRAVTPTPAITRSPSSRNAHCRPVVEGVGGDGDLGGGVRGQLQLDLLRRFGAGEHALQVPQLLRGGRAAERSTSDCSDWWDTIANTAVVNASPTVPPATWNM